jgi:hypothetical protein
MRPFITAIRRLLACPRGTALVGYTSLILLFAMAAVTMLGFSATGTDATRAGKATSAD